MANEGKKDAKTITKTENHEKDVRSEDKVFANGGEVHKNGESARSKPSGLESQLENLNNEQIEKIGKIEKRAASEEKSGEVKGGEETEVLKIQEKEISEGMKEDKKEDKTDGNLDAIAEPARLESGRMIEDRPEVVGGDQKSRHKNDETNEVKQAIPKNETVLERLIRKVYQAAGIQKQIQRQIELIKLDLTEQQPKKQIQIKLMHTDSKKQNNQVPEVDKDDQVKPQVKEEKNKEIIEKQNGIQSKVSLQLTSLFTF